MDGDGYTLEILGYRVTGPGGKAMYSRGVEMWEGMDYGQLVEAEAVCVEALKVQMDGFIALGRGASVQPPQAGARARR